MSIVIKIEEKYYIYKLYLNFWPVVKFHPVPATIMQFCCNIKLPTIEQCEHLPPFVLGFAPWPRGTRQREASGWPPAPPCRSASSEEAPKHPGISHNATGPPAAGQSVRPPGEKGGRVSAGSEAYSGAASWDCDHDSYPLVEGIPLEVGALQVVLQRLGVRVLGGTLNQALAHRVDVLQFGLDAVHLLPLHRLKTRGGLSITTCFLKGLIKIIITTTTLKVTIQKNKRTSTFKKTK